MILVSILGDFHSSILPVFYEFKERLNKHIIIYNSNKNKSINRDNIILGIDNFIQKNRLYIDNILYEIDEYSLKSIHSCIDFLLNEAKSPKRLYINATDGLSNINLTLALRLMPYGVKFISYNRYDNLYNLLTSNSMRRLKIKNSISIREHFFLRGMSIEAINDKKFAIDNEEKIREIFEEHQKEFEKFKKDLDKLPFISPKKYPNIKPIVEEMNLHMTKDISEISGSLFEYYIYLLIKDLNFDDIELGVRVRSYFNQNEYIQNEFDILVMKNNHLHMIECKFRKKIHNIENLVYKYISLTSLIDEDGKSSNNYQ